MNLPYVIDNRAHTLDVATAYVNVGAFDLLCRDLEALDDDELVRQVHARVKVYRIW